MTDELPKRSSAPAAEPGQASGWSPVPSWLLVPPTARDLPAPIQTRPHVLPVARLAWEDLERLCLRILELDSETVHVSTPDQPSVTTMPFAGMYGRRGQAQFGIDVYARDRLVLGETPPTRRYVCLQARRVESMTRAGLRNSVEDFLKGRWADVSRRFIYATSTCTTSTAVLEEIENLSALLAQQGIEFVVWEQETISKRLKSLPKLVDDFFGRHWAEAFCGETAAKALGTRLDALEVADLRRELAEIYTASFGVADSGLLAFRFSETRPVGLLDRFVTPDLISTTPQTASLQQFVDSSIEPGTDEYDLQAFAEEAAELNVILPEEDAWFRRFSALKQRRVANPQVLERRSADQWIGIEPLQVIVGDPGTGKSTLLRYLVLDLLNEEPEWRAVAERWGKCLPVWLPFHFFTQRVAGQTGGLASVAATLKAWLEQHDAGQIWPLVQKALDDQRLLLVVDGLDEWVNEEAGRYAVAALETFSASRSIPLVVSARPYGLARLTLGAGWSYSRIAPLTPEQQRLLALHYFRAVSETEDRASSSAVLERSVDGFLSQVRNVPDLRSLSGTPLFFVLLVGLHLSSVHRLPNERFEMYDQAVQLLVADHPAKRRVAAAVTAPLHRMSSSQLRAILANIAFVSQIRGDISTFQEAQLREDLLMALSDPNYLAMSAADAAKTADQLLNVAEGELGLLVRQGASELGFLHRILQEQLAAEYISNRLDPAEITDLFVKHVGDPRWREVLLATTWRISRPSELRDLMQVIRNRIDEGPIGLRAREMLAEITFGPYDLPATNIQQSAPEIISVIESHPYGAHRARLLDSVLAGLEGTATGDIVRDCLERWTLLVKEPSTELVAEIGMLPPVGNLSETACKLLIMALCNPNHQLAYASAVTIAGRCSKDGCGSGGERDLLCRELLHILSNPASGLAQAAALMALALEWRDDPLVSDLLSEARGHIDEGVRVVALCDALGVLRPTFSDAPTEARRDVQPLTDCEREWLVGRLWTSGISDAHWGLLIAGASEAARDQDSIRRELVASLQSASEPASRSVLNWPVALNVLSDDDQIVSIVCNQLRADAHSQLSLDMMFGNEQLLTTAYGPKSRHNTRVAAAIEDRIRKFKGVIRDRELFGLAAVDRGPLMREALLEDLEASSFPHWASEALAEYFGEDAGVRAALRLMLSGDPVRASMIAPVATRVLRTEEVVPRLLAILRGLAKCTDRRQGRYDFVASALIRACQEQGICSGLDAESIAEVAITLTPSPPDKLGGDPRLRLAAALYPSAASKTALAELAETETRPLEPYLRAFRHDPERVQPFLGDASAILRSLPASLRARVCQALAERAITPEVVMRLTRRWADEVSRLNKSIASLAYHRALVRAKEEGRIEKEQWDLALAHLGEQASCYGSDHEARRCSAWVGMCVCRDWSTLEGRVETIGQPVPVGVPVTDPIYGPDMILLQQVALCWEDLRSEFGDELLTRLSGLRGREPAHDVWDALAIVAAQNVTLQHELDGAVYDNPELLRLRGVLIWHVTQRGTSADAVADALVSHLQSSDDGRDSLVTVLVAESDRIGVPPEELRRRLVDAGRTFPGGLGDLSLEALAVLFPDHPAVGDAWQEFSALIAAARRGGDDVPIPVQTYFAVAYAATESSGILKQIERNLDRLEEIGETRYDPTLTRHVCHRLRRDPVAANMVRDAVLNPATPDSRASQLVSLLTEGIGLDETLLREVERRIAAQDDVRMAPVIRDHAASATVSARTIFTRVADAAWDVRSA